MESNLCVKSTEVKGEQELPSKYAFVPSNLPNWSRLLLSSLTFLPGVSLVMTALDDPLPPSYPPPNSQGGQGWARPEPVALGSAMVSDLGGITGPACWPESLSRTLTRQTSHRHCQQVKPGMLLSPSLFLSLASPRSHYTYYDHSLAGLLFPLTTSFPLLPPISAFPLLQPIFAGTGCALAPRAAMETLGCEV